VRAGHVALAVSDASEARIAFARALALSQESDLRRSALLGRERANHALGNFSEQLRDLEELEVLSRDTPAHTAEALNRRAEALLRTGDYPEVLAAAQRSVAAATRARMPVLEGEALRLIGAAHERAGDYDKGIEISQRALSLFEEQGAKDSANRVRLDMAQSYLAQARYSEARSACERVLEYLEDSANPHLRRTVCILQGTIELQLGEFESAMDEIDRAIDLAGRGGDTSDLGEALNVAGAILLEVGQCDGALEHLERAGEHHARTHSSYAQAECLVRSGLCHLALGEPERALVLLDEAAELGLRMKARAMQARIGIARASVFLTRGADQDLERALDGVQALALSRHAEALRRRGASQRAVVMARSALRILERKRHIDGSEEELLFNTYKALCEVGDPRAQEILERAQESLERKQSRIRRAEWRESFAATPLHLAIRAEVGE
jgi:tetratricopeptide (TPR) repeat protein